MCFVLRDFDVHHSDCYVLLWPVSTEIMLLMFTKALESQGMITAISTWRACNFVLSFLLFVICCILSFVCNILSVL
jgi:uncharacterized membrane protein YecN with MAPEG domain